MTKFKGWEKTAKNCLMTGIAITGLLSISTGVYYLGWMPRTPQPSMARIYLTGAAFNTPVYVTKGELAWVDFIKYDLVTAVGIGVVMFVIFVFIPAARRSSQL